MDDPRLSCNLLLVAWGPVPAVAPSGSCQVGRPSDQRVAGVAASTPTAVFAQGAVQSARIRRGGLLAPAAAAPVPGGFARLAQD
jgi:hypothetical protein